MLYQLFKKLFSKDEQDTRDAYRQIQSALGNHDVSGTVRILQNTVSSVIPLGDRCEYVYDIGMRNERNPHFFANNILVHNSCYFSAYKTLRNDIDAGNFPWDKESMINMYNELAKEVSDTFPAFLKEKLNIPVESTTGVVASSRETVSESGIWMTKKRYACLMIDKDGIRQDVDGKPGKLKAMGLDLKRADTPKVVQKFLGEILMDALAGKGEEAVVEKVRIFKEQFDAMKPWDQGAPRGVNKVSYYAELIENTNQRKMKGYTTSRLHVPGHVTASLNWNRLKSINNDRHSMSIADGTKIIVCKLVVSAGNQYDSIAYPVDETRLPEWFTSLPFDTDAMMASIVDKKVQNVLGVLKWDFSRASKEHAHLSTLFDFGAM